MESELGEMGIVERLGCLKVALSRMIFYTMVFLFYLSVRPFVKYKVSSPMDDYSSLLSLRVLTGA